VSVLPNLGDLRNGEADRCSGLTGRKVAVVAKASRDSFGEGVALTFDLGLTDQERCARIRLSRDQSPGEGLQQAGGDGLVGLCLPLGCLVALVLSQVEVGLVVENVLPAQVVAGGVVELLKSGLADSVPRLWATFGCRMTSRASSVSGMSALFSGQTWTPAKSPFTRP
jgi:hypothetical protein